MKRGYIHKHFPAVLLTLFSMLFLGGCTKENLDDCPWIPARVKVVVNTTKSDANPDDVKGVKLYVFDRNDLFLDEVDAQINQIVNLNYPDAGSPLQIVAVANPNNGVNEIITRCSDANHISGANITLIKKGDYSDLEIPTLDVVGSPSDLFHGQLVVANEGRRSAQTHEVLITRIVGSTKVTLRNAEKHFNVANGDFSVVAVTNHRTVNFYGQPSGGKVGYEPVCGYNSDRDFVASVFNLFSSQQGEEVTIKICYQGNVIDQITADKEGNPLRTENGKLLDILVDYSAGLQVTVSVNPWGEETVWKKYE